MAPNDNDHYDTTNYAGDQAMVTHQVLNHIPFVNPTASSRVDLQDSITNRQASTLASDVQMGDDRVLGDTPNWHGFSSQQLYDFATRDNVPSSADDLGRAFTDGGNRLAEAANALYEAVTALEGAWTGVAADSARTALAPLAQAAGQSGQSAQMMGVQMSRQSIAATEVRKLPPPKEIDEQQALQQMITGGPAAMQADLRAQREAADAVKREQISYLDSYTQAMVEVDAQTPTFVPPPTGSINPEAGGGSPITGSSVPVSDGGGVSGGFHGGSGDEVNGGTTPGPGGGWVGAAPGASSGDEASFGDNGDGSGDFHLAIPGTIPNTSASGFAPGASPVTTTPTSLPGGVPGGTPAAPAAGSGGFGSAFGNFGGGSGGAAGAGGAGAGAGTGGGSGARPGVPSTGPGGTGSAATGGAGGRGGVGQGAGGRRADGEDDDEHERPSYLVEGDPDSAFGNDQLTAPSVIGGDGNG